MIIGRNSICEMTPLKDKLRKYCIMQFEYEKYKIDGKKKRFSIDRYTRTGRFSHSVKYDLLFHQLEPIVNKLIENNKMDFVKF